MPLRWKRRAEMSFAADGALRGWRSRLGSSHSGPLNVIVITTNADAAVSLLPSRTGFAPVAVDFRRLYGSWRISGVASVSKVEPAD